ncbi:mesoderm induction early response protein 1-like [Haliotis rubra]|uniref:mesoderm induction early response protein 1-like n=1 Tax=Haliotis rubra TaxID=36100 RepID=UPI001EE59136|nr:mesoderm induction early response protein 1-like [Haliotis rubra]
MAEPAGSESSSPETDKDFDPSADMLVHDYDDEHTLDEEEALSGESCSNELDDLAKEGDMPIEDLLAMYGCGQPNEDDAHDNTRSSSEEEILSNHDLTLDKDEIARDLLKNNSEADDKETSVTDLFETVATSHTARLLRSSSRPGSEDDSEDSEEDVDYKPEHEEDWKKVIQVGHDYQAVVPEGLSKYGDAPAYENEDRLLWNPSKTENDTVEKYLKDVHEQNLMNAQGVNCIPTGTHVRDDEQALYLLLQCGHNVEEALRRRKMQAVPTSDPMSLWSEEECRNFENGLRTYGKNFYLIQQNKVRTRSVGELVQFYYLWKKTERHDIFAHKNRLEKRKYALHPGVTDYMDRFLDDQDAVNPTRDRSASPNLNSLIYGDPKRTHIKQELEEQASCPPESKEKVSEVCTASTTAVALSPDRKDSQSKSESVSVKTDTNLNGSAEDLHEPPSKRLKSENKEKSISEPLKCVSGNHIESLQPLPLNTTVNSIVAVSPVSAHELAGSGEPVLQSRVISPQTIESSEMNHV